MPYIYPPNFVHVFLIVFVFVFMVAALLTLCYALVSSEVVQLWASEDDVSNSFIFMPASVVSSIESVAPV